MTPPDAMSWGEAVAVLEAATPEIVGRAERAEHKRALAAIQSHRVQAEDAHKGALAALVASVSLLERGGKKAAPSNHMFQMMIADYKKAIDISRAALAAAANNDGGGA